MNTNGRIPTDREHYMVTLVVFTIILYFGATLTALGRIFAVIGGFTTTALGLLLPGMVYLNISFTRSRKMPPLLASSHSYSSSSSPTILLLGAVTLVLISFPIMYFSIISVFV